MSLSTPEAASTSENFGPLHRKYARPSTSQFETPLTVRAVGSLRSIVNERHYTSEHIRAVKNWHSAGANGTLLGDDEYYPSTEAALTALQSIKDPMYGILPRKTQPLIYASGFYHDLRALPIMEEDEEE